MERRQERSCGRGPRRVRRRAGDHANLYVLEAVLIAFLLVGSAYAVTTLRRSSTDNVRPREGLERLGSDALTVLDGLADANGSLLEVSILDAIHCASDATPSTVSCHGSRPANLTLKLAYYLPSGAGWSLQLGNGAGSRVVHQTGQPSGEATSSSIAYTPQWNTTFVLPELTCYGAASPVNVSMLPLHRARTSNLSALNVSYGGATQAVAERSQDGWWNATIPAGARPATAILSANASGRGAPFNGSTSLATCDLASTEAAIVTALRSVTFAPSSAAVPLGGDVTFSASLGSLDALPGVTRGGAEIVLYEPVTPRMAPDTWIQAARLPMPSGLSPSATWSPPSDAFYGAHVAVLRVNLTVGSQPVVAQRAAVVDVALPTGQVPIDPIYRAHLQTWLRDWG